MHRSSHALITCTHHHVYNRHMHRSPDRTHQACGVHGDDHRFVLLSREELKNRNTKRIRDPQDRTGPSRTQQNPGPAETHDVPGVDAQAAEQGLVAVRAPPLVPKTHRLVDVLKPGPHGAAYGPTEPTRTIRTNQNHLDHLDQVPEGVSDQDLNLWCGHVELTGCTPPLPQLQASLGHRGGPAGPSETPPGPAAGSGRSSEGSCSGIASLDVWTAVPAETKKLINQV